MNAPPYHAEAMRFTNFMEHECRKALLDTDWRYCQQPTNATTQNECANTLLGTGDRAALGADGWEPTAAQRRRWTKEVAKAWRNVSSGVPLAEYKWPT